MQVQIQGWAEKLAPYLAEIVYTATAGCVEEAVSVDVWSVHHGSFTVPAAGQVMVSAHIWPNACFGSEGQYLLALFENGQLLNHWLGLGAVENVLDFDGDGVDELVTSVYESSRGITSGSFRVFRNYQDAYDLVAETGPVVISNCATEPLDAGTEYSVTGYLTPSEPGVFPEVMFEVELLGYCD